MLGYLSKFVLQMLPTISATVIGAYIVATWINPKTPPEPAKAAARAQGQDAGKAASADKAAAKVSPAAGAEQPEAAAAEAKAAEAVEAAKPVNAASTPENIRIIPIVKEKAPATDSSVAAATPAPETAASVDERKDVNELARAAIQRLRAGAETARSVDEAAKPVASSVRAHQARVAPEPVQSSPVAIGTSAPPLPPPVTIASPRYPQDDGADQAPSDRSDRLAPPAEIPAVRNPLSLEARHRVAGNPSFADDVLSATKSLFRAITPPQVLSVDGK